VLTTLKAFLARAGSVRDDWFTGLPDQKRQLFETAVGNLESAYQMLSVTLDEAFSLRAKGHLVRSRQQVAISADLLDRLAERVLEALAALEEQGRRPARPPQVTALNADFFRGDTAQGIALVHRLLHPILLTRRLRFRHKLRALTRTVDELAGEFRQAAEEISNGASIHPEASWRELECLHYDLNTCLRETIVVLKSFLVGLPAGQFAAFQRRLESPVPPLHRRFRPRFSRV
jgi:hypothetical protein